MFKKLFAIFISLLLVSVLIYGYIYLSNFKNYKNNQAIKAIPADASLILQIQKPNKFGNQIINSIKYKKALSSFNYFNNFIQNLQIYRNDSLLKNESIEILKNRSLTISFHIIGKDNFHPLFIYSLNNKAEQIKLISFLEEEKTTWDINKRNYNTHDIYSIGLKQGIKIYASFYRGLLVISNSSIIVENSLRQLRSEFSLLNDKTFSKLFKTIGNNADANLLVNFNEVNNPVSILFNKGSKKLPSFLTHVANWGEFDINIKEENLLINGFLYASNSEVKINQLFKDINPASSKINKIVSDNSVFVISYSFDDNNKLRKNLVEYWIKTNQLKKYNHNIDAIGINIKNSQIIENFFDIIDDEFALVYGNSKNIDKAVDKYLIIKTKSKSKTISLINELNEKEIEPYSNYKLDQQINYPIYKCNFSKVFPTILSTYCPNPPNNFFTFINNYVVFSDSEESLSNIIYDNILNKTLDNNKHHQRFLNMFSYKENIFIYSDISKLSSLLPNASDFELLNPTKSQKIEISKFYGLGIQLTNTNDLLYLNASIEYAEDRETEPETIWQSGLDSTIIGKPALVTNHYTKEKEILVQDKSNMLYLISNAGRILWKKKLEAPILSEIFQIDYYRNNKLQYLFNTSDKIHLIDRNGNNVEKYPNELAYNATNGISVFDYDKNRNYRIFVACSNHKIYVYDKSGKKITGWKAKPTEGEVILPIQHFRVMDKDYIVFSDDKRNYILNRRGKDRVSIEPDFISNITSKFNLEIKNNIPFLLNTDNKGYLQRINLINGNCKQVKLLSKEQAHYFVVDNINSEAGNEYIFVTNNKVSCFNSNNKKLFELKIDGELMLLADLYHFSSNNKKIGVFDTLNNEIYLINNDGTIYNNFPLRGKSRFSIGFMNMGSHNFNLIVGGDNNYLYNYKVQ